MVSTESSADQWMNPIRFPDLFCSDDIHMYTGRFSQCREVLLNSLIFHYFDRINDIYVDNTAAGLRQPHLLQQACAHIKQIVR